MKITLPIIHEKFTRIIASLVRLLFSFFEKILGYPGNPGMKFASEIDYDWYHDPKLELPFHSARIPPSCHPRTYLEILIGNSPRVSKFPRVFFSNSEGFYNFYTLNFRNLVTLPNWLSEFIQVHFNMCLDVTPLEVGREVFFIVIIFYYHLITFRITLNWFLRINPYSFPLVYIVALTDWFENNVGHFIPTVKGVSFTASVFLSMVGKVADILNHLIFTMPFLPSEGSAEKVMINGELRDALVFRHLPFLWYKYPIPNELREFWYEKRPDILEFFQKAYKETGINFLPDDHINLIGFTNLSDILHTFIPINGANYNLMLFDFNTVNFTDINLFVQFNC